MDVLEERRAPYAQLFLVLLIAVAMRVVLGLTVFAEGDVPLEWRIPLGLIGGLTAVAVYPWLAPTHHRNVPILATALIAIHPTVVAATTQSMTDVALGAIWVVMLVVLSRFHLRFQLTMTIVLAAATVLRFRQITDAETQSAMSRIIETWSLADSNAPLRSVLAAYLFDGVAYLFAAIGLFYILRKNAAVWVLPLAVFAFTVLVGSTYPHSATRASVFPLLLPLSAEGLWRVYAGLGKTGGHGILAVDPVRKKRQ